MANCALGSMRGFLSGTIPLSRVPVGGNSQVRVFCVFQARSPTNTDFIHGQLVDETNNQYSQNT